MFAPSKYVTVPVSVLFRHEVGNRIWSGTSQIADLLMLFDYFFLGSAVWKIEGAAIATGIGQMIPAVVGTAYFFFFKGELHLCRSIFMGQP